MAIQRVTPGCYGNASWPGHNQSEYPPGYRPAQQWQDWRGLNTWGKTFPTGYNATNYQVMAAPPTLQSVGIQRVRARMANIPQSAVPLPLSAYSLPQKTVLTGGPSG